MRLPTGRAIPSRLSTLWTILTPVIPLERWRRAVLLLTACSALAPALAAAANRVSAEYWPTRQGVSARVLLISPPNSWGAVILLPGGHGNINLDRQGLIGWGQDDFLVRTRADYVGAGLTVAIPDVATDQKPPARLNGYRTSEKQAYDLRSISGRLRRMVTQVWLVGFDQAAASVLTTVAKHRADLIAGLVLVSPVLGRGVASKPLWDGAGAAIRGFPMLVLYHKGDRCSADVVSRLDRIAASVAAPTYRSVKLSGGSGDDKLPSHLSYYADACNRKASHALVGLESEAARIIVDWLTAQKSPRN
jgi:hypothetical protein